MYLLLFSVVIYKNQYSKLTISDMIIIIIINYFIRLVLKYKKKHNILIQVSIRHIYQTREQMALLIDRILSI